MSRRMLGVDPDASTLDCCACGREHYSEDVQRFWNGQRALKMCESCAEDAHRELAEPLEDDAVTPEMFDKLEQRAKMGLILSFIPADEQINDQEDIEAFFDALTALIVWHPDTDFNEYFWAVGHPKGGQQIFGPSQGPNSDIECLNNCMDRCIEVLDAERAKVVPDVYDLGMKSLQKAVRAPKVVSE